MYIKAYSEYMAYSEIFRIIDILSQFQAHYSGITQELFMQFLNWHTRETVPTNMDHMRTQDSMMAQDPMSSQDLRRTQDPRRTQNLNRI